MASTSSSYCGGPYTHIRLTPPADDDGVALLTLAREPVNTMDGALWGELGRALTGLEAAHRAGLDSGAALTPPTPSSPSPHYPRAVVIESGLARDVFTAGNDIAELYAPGTTQAAYTSFWVLQNTVLSSLLVSPLVTVAAIRGACPAGGCALALCCDVRVLLDGPAAVIGLNEVGLGIPVPKMWGALMARVVGQATAERLCMGAALVGAGKALEAGLVDTLVPGGGGAGALRSAALAAARSLVRAGPDAGRAATKLGARGEFASAWAAYAPGEAAGAWAMLASPATVRALKSVMDRLASKKARL